ncbi:MAG TPA: hypothetical protein VFG76_01245, partial [Candidatus Polarisedimenticolia bacterium]|nr:hypothetical protein [Candidatus Polarisedimenticolia bacterium]
MRRHFGDRTSSLGAARWLAVLLLALAAGALADPAFAERPRVFAITGARVITAPGKIIENCTVVIRDGLIEAAGSNVTPPADALLIDGSGKTVTAGFIDACTDIGQKKTEGPPPGGGESGGSPQRSGPKEP